MKHLTSSMAQLLHDQNNIYLRLKKRKASSGYSNYDKIRGGRQVTLFGQHSLRREEAKVDGWVMFHS